MFYSWLDNFWEGSAKFVTFLFAKARIFAIQTIYQMANQILKSWQILAKQMTLVAKLE